MDKVIELVNTIKVALDVLKWIRECNPIVVDSQKNYCFFCDTEVDYDNPIHAPNCVYLLAQAKQNNGNI